MSRGKWLILLVILAWVAYIGFSLQSNLHDACRRGIASNVTTIGELNSRITHTREVVEDPKQPPETKAARASEIGELEAFRLRRYRHVDPTRGGPLRCPSPPIVNKILP